MITSKPLKEDSLTAKTNYLEDNCLKRLRLLNDQLNICVIELESYVKTFKKSPYISICSNVNFVQLTRQEFAHLGKLLPTGQKKALINLINTLKELHSLPATFHAHFASYIKQRQRNSNSFLRVNHLQTTYYQEFRRRYFTTDLEGNLIYRGTNNAFTAEFNSLVEEFDSVINDPQFNFHKHQVYILSAFMEPLVELAQKHPIEDEFINEIYELINDIKNTIERQTKNNKDHIRYLNDTTSKLRRVRKEIDSFLSLL